MSKLTQLIFILIFAVVLTGCQTRKPSKIAYKSQAELAAMEKQAEDGRNYFQQGKYEDAEKSIKPLCAETTVSKPLYQCELASIYLMEGQKEEAHRAMLDAHTMLEYLYDERGEKKAASVWGDEAEKVYKGDPYERCSLYVLLALSLLERGDTGNALAAIKTGLIADSDAEKNTYKADYALLHFLAAKCYDLRGEYEMRDKMLHVCFDSFLNDEKSAASFARLLQEQCRQQYLPQSSSRILRLLGSLADENQLQTWLKTAGLSPAEIKLLIDHIKKAAENYQVLKFNTLLVIWRGTPPHFYRTGEYGEIRKLALGAINDSEAYSIITQGDEYDSFQAFADLNFQASTRGKRVMDEILKNKADSKKATDSTADVLMTAGTAMMAGDIVTTSIGGGMVIAGLITKGVASQMTAKADIRHWNNLPHSFAVVPLYLEPGTHNITVCRWYQALLLDKRDIKVEVDTVRKFNVCHIPAHGNFDIQKYLFGDSGEKKIIFDFAMAPPAKDDFVIDEAEQKTIMDSVIKNFDTDKDGKISTVEYQLIQVANQNKFANDMTKIRIINLDEDKK